MLEYKGKKREQVTDMLDAMSNPQELTDWIMGWETEWGVNAQIGLVNTLYRIAQMRGFIIGGTTTLGELISIDQNHSRRQLTEKQAAAIARDVFLYGARGRQL